MLVRRAVVLVSLCAALNASAQDPTTHGAANSYEKLLKIRSVASLLHVTAHPDDEHGGVLTHMSRGEGVYVALTSLTRGEAGANAIGSELFDALGTVRSEELRLASTFYGVDRLSFTRLADYGFSKRIEEAQAKWPREQALRDLVLIIRQERPQVIVSRFQGTPRDGHGQHQFAGWIARQAFEISGDPDVFADQLVDGVSPWRAKRLFLGGFRHDEPWHVAISSHDYSPRLGASYEELARRGLSKQRSQTSGRIRPVTGKTIRYYQEPGRPTGTLDGLFDGLDTTLVSLATEESARDVLIELQHRTDEAIDAFDWLEPSASSQALVDIRQRFHVARQAQDVHSAALFEIDRKLSQVDAALSACLGLELDALALSPDEAPSENAFARTPLLDAPSPGDSFDVVLRAGVRGQRAVHVEALRIEAPGWQIEASYAFSPQPLEPEQHAVQRVHVVVPVDAPVLSPTVTRTSIAEPIYASRGGTAWSLARPEPHGRAVAIFRIGSDALSVSTPVQRQESALPFGTRARILRVLPTVSVYTSPQMVLLPSPGNASGKDKTIRISSRVVHHTSTTRRMPSRGTLRLLVPEGWSVQPRSVSFELSSAGEQYAAEFELSVSSQLGSGSPSIVSAEAPMLVTAIARMEDSGREYSNAYQRIDHPELGLRYQIVPAPPACWSQTSIFLESSR